MKPEERPEFARAPGIGSGEPGCALPGSLFFVRKIRGVRPLRQTETPAQVPAIRFAPANGPDDGS